MLGGRELCWYYHWGQADATNLSLRVESASPFGLLLMWLGVRGLKPLANGPLLSLFHFVRCRLGRRAVAHLGAGHWIVGFLDDVMYPILLYCRTEI